MCSTGSTEDVLQQMSKLWSMLDDLSENDPAAYRTLIEKQIKEGAEFRAPPELDSCLCTEILVSFIRVGPSPYCGPYRCCSSHSLVQLERKPTFIPPIIN